MNALSTLYTKALTVLAQAPAPAPKGEEPGMKFFGEDGIIGTWQLILILVMLGLVGFWVYYRKKQQED